MHQVIDTAPSGFAWIISVQPSMVFCGPQSQVLQVMLLRPDPAKTSRCTVIVCMRTLAKEDFDSAEMRDSATSVSVLVTDI